jgi:pimeloyl-ACP methyl ester carboxylesterase
LAGGKTIPKLLAKASSGKGSVVTDRLVGEVRKLPAEVWPIVVSHWCLPRGFHTIAEYLERLPENCEAPLNPRSLTRIPTVVVSAGSAPEEVRAAHARTVAEASAGWHIIAEGSGHWVQLDRPELAAEAVTRLLQLDT